MTHDSMMTPQRTLLVFAAALTLLIGSAPAALAQEIPGQGSLGSLYLQRGERVAHYSSYDRSGGNTDRRDIQPGDSLTLFEHDGAGIVRRWWITIAPRNNQEIQRQLIVRCYWDGEAEPSVEVPVSDFFGMGFGEWKDYISLPLNMTSGGYNSYWPMPFKERGRCMVENTSEVPIEAFYYNIDIETHESLPEDALYFHAQYRQTITREGQPVTILETEGRGQYVGTLLSMQPQSGNHLGYLEGDQRIFIDGEEEPSIIGTGTEDYFSSGWYYDTGEYSAPYHGVTIKDEDGRINTYRWHIEDPIPFDESLRFNIEHGGVNDAPGVEYASVAYWYQTHPHPAFPALPENLMPMSTAAVPEIEAEDLVDRAQATGGEIQTQDLSGYEGSTWGGGAHLWWTLAEPGDRLSLPLEAPSAGEYELVGFFTRAQDYGIVRLHVNGQALRPLVDGYASEVEASGPVSFGRVPMEEGENEVVVELIGKDARSAGYSGGYLVGIDGFLLREPRGP